MRTVEIQINTEGARTTYVLLVSAEDADETEERIHKVIGSSLLLGASLLDAQWSAEGAYRVTPHVEDTP